MPPISKIDKIKIVVEYNELDEKERDDYLKKNGINKKTFQEYQQEAASALGISPPKPKTKCERLIDELQNDNENVRRDAVKALGYMRHRATSAVNALIDTMLNDPIDFVRSWSAWALTRIEPRNPNVIQGFFKGLTEDEASLNTREWCAVGLGVCNNDEMIERLVDVLHNGQPYAQFASIQALSRTRITSPRYVQGLELALKSENGSLRKLVKIELSKLQSDNQG